MNGETFNVKNGEALAARDHVARTAVSLLLIGLGLGATVAVGAGLLAAHVGGDDDASRYIRLMAVSSVGPVEETSTAISTNEADVAEFVLNTADIAAPGLAEVEIADGGSAVATSAGDSTAAANEAPSVEVISQWPIPPAESNIRYFDGRPIRPVRTVTMIVTAYSPDARSCAPSDDGITASGFSVWTNGGMLIAADPKYKFGSLLSVPGYNGNRPTPVLDRGGAIKGNRLDVLYPTHEIARRWGRQKLQVTVWEYADDLPAKRPHPKRG